ncbi:MAG: hypothetical protein RI979_2294, partial [Pseudomonadota bacterium]
MTPKDCAVIGTPEARSIFGTSPRTAISAAKRAIWVRLRSMVASLR